MTATTIVPPATIAVIGLGNMGRPMGACLARAGFTLTGFDTSAEMRAAFARETGGAAFATLAETVAKADAVITMLPNGAIVAKVVHEMRPHLRPGTVLIEMSSSEPIGTAKLAAEMIAAGFAFIDAPVSGGVKRAVDGSLAIMAGGEAATIDRVEPVLQAMGRSVFRTGPVGSGHAMKALNNYVSGAGLIAALEALDIAKAFGLDRNILVDVLNSSTGRNNSTEVKLKQFVISETYGSGFFMGLMAKDIRTAHKLAQELNVEVPLADRCADLWDEAAEKLGPTADHTAVRLAVSGKG